MSHDPLLDKFREVRSLLTKFREAMKKQSRFSLETATAFRLADDEFWNLQESHDRRKHAGLDASSTVIEMNRLKSFADKWTGLCELADRGEPISNEQISS